MWWLGPGTRVPGGPGGSRRALRVEGIADGMQSGVRSPQDVCMTEGDDVKNASCQSTRFKKVSIKRGLVF